METIQKVAYKKHLLDTGKCELRAISAYDNFGVYDEEINVEFTAIDEGKSFLIGVMGRVRRAKRERELEEIRHYNLQIKDMQEKQEILKELAIQEARAYNLKLKAEQDRAEAENQKRIDEARAFNLKWKAEQEAKMSLIDKLEQEAIDAGNFDRIQIRVR